MEFGFTFHRSSPRVPDLIQNTLGVARVQPIYNGFRTDQTCTCGSYRSGSGPGTWRAGSGLGASAAGRCLSSRTPRTCRRLPEPEPGRCAPTPRLDPSGLPVSSAMMPGARADSCRFAADRRSQSGVMWRTARWWRSGSPACRHVAPCSLLWLCVFFCGTGPVLFVSSSSSFVFFLNFFPPAHVTLAGGGAGGSRCQLPASQPITATSALPVWLEEEKQTNTPCGTLDDVIKTNDTFHFCWSDVMLDGDLLKTLNIVFFWWSLVQRLITMCCLLSVSLIRHETSRDIHDKWY